MKRLEDPCLLQAGKTEDRRPKTEDGRRKTEDGRPLPAASREDACLLHAGKSKADSRWVKNQSPFSSAPFSPSPLTPSISNKIHFQTVF